MADSLPNSRVTLDSSAGATVQNIDEKGQLRTQKEALFSNAETRSFTGDVQWLVHLQPAAASGISASGAAASGASASSGDLKGTVTFMAIYKDSVVGPVEVPFRYAHTADGGLVAKAAGLQGSASAANELKKASVDLANPVNKCGGTGAENSKSKGMLGRLLPGDTWWPGRSDHALYLPYDPADRFLLHQTFGLSFQRYCQCLFIRVLYISYICPDQRSLLFPESNNANILNNIATNVWLNLFFAVVFLVFALVLFWAF